MSVLNECVYGMSSAAKWNKKSKDTARRMNNRIVAGIVAGVCSAVVVYVSCLCIWAGM